MIDDDYLVSGSFRCTIAYYHKADSHGYDLLR